jgi:CMP-N-acetylneuraminic acid synthetase
MIKGKTVVAIIPARASSKGLPDKNIKKLLGKPLISYTINAALHSKFIDRTIVSTDGKKIAEIAKRCGAEVIKRPKKLARDRTPMIDVVFHALDFLKNENYDLDMVVLLQPTSPLRNTKSINSAIELSVRNDCKSIVSVCEMKRIYWTFKIQNGYLEPLFKKYFEKRRQDLDKAYLPNGAIYISTPQNLYKYKSFHCDTTIPDIMPHEKSVDIDKEIDFKLAELIMKKREEDTK